MKVNVKCKGCNKEFKSQIVLKYCPACRAAYRKAHPKVPKNTAKKQRPMKQMKKAGLNPNAKVFKPQQNQVERVTRALAKVSTGNNGLINPSIQNNNRAKGNGFRSLIESALDPVSTQGAQAVNFSIDDIGESQLPMVADNSYSMSLQGVPNGVEPLVRIVQIANPVITHLIWCNLGSSYIVIEGAKTFNVDENTVAILGNKLEFLGTLSGDQFFTPSKEYNQYRILSVSDNIRYNGKVIDVSGNMYTSQVQNPLEIGQVSPYQIADSVRSPMIKAVTRVAQHKQAVFDYQYVESQDNAENSKGNMITLNNMINFSQSESSAFTLKGLDNPAFISGATAANQLASWYASGFNSIMSSNTLVTAFSNYFDDINEKYGIYQDNYKTLTITHNKTVTILASINVSNATGPTDVANAAIWQNYIQHSSTAYSPQVYVSEEGDVTQTFTGDSATSGVEYYLQHLATTDPVSDYEVNQWGGLTAAVPLATGMLKQATKIDFQFKFRAKIPPSLRTDSMVDYPGINLISVIEDDMAGYFNDPHYKVALTEISVGNGEMNIMITSRYLYQLIVNIKSVLGLQAKRCDYDTNSVKGNQMSTYAKITRALPPAIIEGEAMSQLKGRGLLGDIAGTVGSVFLGKDAGKVIKDVVGSIGI